MIERICTIGPASNSRKILEKLIDQGMTIIRLNLSHGDHQSHNQVIELVRKISNDKNKKIKILGDLQGPKIRLGLIKKEEVSLNEGDEFVLTTLDVEGDEKSASIDYKGLIQDVKLGSKILINDGEVELIVKEIKNTSIVTNVKTGGTISSRKGVNVPGTPLNLPAITEKDKKDIHFLIEKNVDYIACSFIRTPEHIQEIRNFIKTLTNLSPKVMAKIETMEAIKHFEEICEIADAIMIARGDLGVELPFYWIPLLQKGMIKECNQKGTFVVTATQMLQSMVDEPIPTRAEVTDIFQAVLDGTNAVMLSAESAAGSFPVKSLKTLRTVSQFAESVKHKTAFDFSDIIKLIDQE